MKKLQLNFMVVPEFLESHCEVRNRVKVSIVKPKSPFLRRILGESGRRMVNAGIPFYFKDEIAAELIERGIAKRLDT